MGRLIKQAAMLATVSVLVALAQVPAARSDAPSPTQAGPLVEVLASSRLEFSPNGDGRGDRAVLRFRLAERSQVVLVLQRDDRTLLGPVPLGELAAGKHVWRWNGRDTHGRKVDRGPFVLTVKAGTAGRHDRAAHQGVIDAYPPSGRLLTTRSTMYPQASAVADRFEMEYVPRPGDRQSALFTVREPGGPVLLRERATLDGAHTFVWDGRDAGGQAVPEGSYRTRLVVADRADNRVVHWQSVTISHAQLEMQALTTTLPADKVTTFVPPVPFGCNGCGDRCPPVASTRYVDGLSFRPCADPTFSPAENFTTTFPGAFGPADSVRFGATGGPTVAGGTDIGFLSGTQIGPGDGTFWTDWDVLGAQEGGADATSTVLTWGFGTSAQNSYDIASFTVEYRQYVTAS
jgi:hypothetical protein